jgi:uncharacterized protein with NRDE domain
MIEKLNPKGLNLSSIAQDAGIQKSKLYFAVKDYDTRAKTVLTPREENKVFTVLRKMHQSLGRILHEFDNS